MTRRTHPQGHELKLRPALPILRDTELLDIHLREVRFLAVQGPLMKAAATATLSPTQSTAMARTSWTLETRGIRRPNLSTYETMNLCPKLRLGRDFDERQMTSTNER